MYNNTKISATEYNEDNNALVHYDEFERIAANTSAEPVLNMLDLTDSEAR